MRAPAIGRPDTSRARACRRSVSPATTTGDAGVIATRAMLGDACCAGCWRTRKRARMGVGMRPSPEGIASPKVCSDSDGRYSATWLLRSDRLGGAGRIVEQFLVGGAGDEII